MKIAINPLKRNFSNKNEKNMRIFNINYVKWRGFSYF